MSGALCQMWNVQRPWETVPEAKSLLQAATLARIVLAATVLAAEA